MHPPPIGEPMRGSTPLASYACRVQQQANDDIEGKLVEALSAWQNGSASDRQRLGEPHTIVLESEMVPSLAARLRGAPWMEVVTAVPGTSSPAVGVNRAMLLLGYVLRLVHPFDADFGSSAQPSTHVMQTLVQQVCTQGTLPAS